MNSPLKIIISGGGTGGHIFPALAIADAIRDKVPGAVIRFVGAKGKMEMERVPRAGYSIDGLWISGLQRKFTLSNILFPVKLLFSLIKARAILKSFRPHIVIGVGGYASGPTLFMANYLGIKTLIQEQNSFPGITNQMLGKKATCICVAYENMDKWFPANKLVLSGNPLRNSAIEIEGKKTEALHHFKLNHSLPIVLIIGGSQGSKAINNAILLHINSLINKNVQVIWQTGETFVEIALQGVTVAQGENLIRPVAFINRMDLAYAAADVIVSRAGAMSISEISMVKKPTIFVPLPSAAEDHQTKNALQLVVKNAALLVRNAEADEKLVDTIIALLGDETKKMELSANISAFALPNATDVIVNKIIQLTT